MWGQAFEDFFAMLPILAILVFILGIAVGLILGWFWP
jgi:hypothetical protein